MKIYEKPMAIIEKIECEDIMTTSGDPLSSARTALATQAGTEEAIVFEW